MNNEEKSNTTIDSSVLVSMFVKKEVKSDEARSMVYNLISQNVNVILPNIVLIEVVSAIVRRTNSVKVATTTFEILKSIPNFNFVNIDDELTKYCHKVTIKTKLKSLDAIILSTALMYDSNLITFDKKLNSAYSEIIQDS